MKTTLILAGMLICAAPLSYADSADKHIRVLAASCAACHGTNGNSVGGTPVLAGLDPNHFILQMNAFRTGERASTVMLRHAKGLNEQEIAQLAQFFSEQPRRPAQAPLPMKGEE